MKHDSKSEKSFDITSPSVSLPKGGGAIKGIGETVKSGFLFRDRQLFNPSIWIKNMTVRLLRRRRSKSDVRICYGINGQDNIS